MEEGGDCSRRKRGRYKLYNLTPDDVEYNPAIPKTTSWRRGQGFGSNQPLNYDVDGESESGTQSQTPGRTNADQTDDDELDGTYSE